MAAPNTFVFSRDGTHLLYLAAAENGNQQLYALDIATGETRLRAITSQAAVHRKKRSHWKKNCAASAPGCWKSASPIFNAPNNATVC